MPNRLLDERSPYLQQHAHNPVEWYPWGEEAFEQARREDRPIFLSIGYSTCHWCHVMERESFEDVETARLMNEWFINIKVDREERPDVDAIYMTAAQALTGSGGWPLSAWLTPDLQPFYLGTYFPPRPAYGRASFRQVLQGLHDAWMGEREKVLSSAGRITDALRSIAQLPTAAPDAAVRAGFVEGCLANARQLFDPVEGGFGGAPKFPRPVVLEFLLRYGTLHANPDVVAMARETLLRISTGGIFDHLGGGFSRYSVDGEWRIPHFEKMLYDQGQLLGTLADAWRFLPDPEFERAMRETVVYLERDMRHPLGFFFAAEDADSEGEEGRFYVWTPEQLRAVLDERSARLVELLYDIKPGGTFEHGTSVLHRGRRRVEDVAEEMGLPIAEAEAIHERARLLLLAERSKRVRPARDEKVIAAWNGLAIGGLARTAMALGDPAPAQLAGGAAEAVLAHLVRDGRLMRRWIDGETAVPGHIEDYAFMAWGLLDLFEATGDARWLREAERLGREGHKLFADESGTGWYTTDGSDSTLLVRTRGDHDGAEPTGASVMALVLLRLGSLFDDAPLRESALRALGALAERHAQHPFSMPMAAAAMLVADAPPRQIVIAVGEDRAQAVQLARAARQRYHPDTTLLLLDDGEGGKWLRERMPMLKGMRPFPDGASAIYICEGFVCHAPVRELPE